MLNQVILVGRLVKDPEVVETENGRKVSHITIAVPRSFKNENGEYDTDFLDCTLWNFVATHTTEYCKKGDIVGIKGRLESNTFEKEGKKQNSMNVVAEKVTFLSSNKSKDNENEIEKDSEIEM